MKVSDFTYDLPEELIAQFPPKERGTSRLLVLDRRTGALQHRKYADLADFLNPGDVLVLNDTKVIKARLLAINAAGQPRELLLLEDHHTIDPYTRKALYRGKLRPGETLKVGKDSIMIDEVLDGGIARISSTTPLLTMAEHAGTVPLPPYMHRKATEEDIKRYQTVFAHAAGSVAAPTASLNFTEDLRKQLKAKGVQLAFLTLHVGLGTFLPIRSDEIEDHTMHSEYFEISAETVAILQKAHNNRFKIVALGTTVARTLEFVTEQIFDQAPKNLNGEANIFIYPEHHTFKVVDALLTNFHAPKSTVLMLAAAFAGWDNLQKAYQSALDEQYAFLSYGDSMLIM